MKLHRIRAILHRLWISSFLNPSRIFEDVYWPTLDIMLWGIASTWLKDQQGALPHLALAMLTGVIFWTIVLRSNQEISYTIYWELLDRNFVNLFSTPLTLGEWITATLVIGIGKVCFAVAVGSIVTWLMYTLNIFSSGLALIPLAIQLIFFGWSIGFMNASLLIYWGNRVQSIMFALWWVAAPFSTVFYPLEALPCWMQYVARCLPTAYVFEGMRSVIAGNGMPWDKLAIASALNLIYLSGTITLFYTAFEKSRVKGLGRLE